MRNDKTSIMILDDDSKICNDFESYIKTREDVKLVGKTNSSSEAIKLVKNLKPEAVIVDLELHNGYGSGFEFLMGLRNLNLSFSPLVVVNTNVKSPSIYENIHNGFADLIFYKKQEGYSIEYIINAILFSKNSNSDSSELKIENNLDSEIDDLKSEENKRITKLINIELDSVGISQKLRGRNYIFDALMYMLTENPVKVRDISPLQYVANSYKMFPSSVGRGIQTVINSAWNRTPIEDLEESYKAKFSMDTGVPTAMEFIYYYYNKIKNKL